jgi:hypothetical protein
MTNLQTAYLVQANARTAITNCRIRDYFRGEYGMSYDEVKHVMELGRDTLPCKILGLKITA